MNIGKKVKWTTASGVHGTGTVVGNSGYGITDWIDPLHVFVAVDAEPGEEHRMIWCALTWLTVL